MLRSSLHHNGTSVINCWLQMMLYQRSSCFKGTLRPVEEMADWPEGEGQQGGSQSTSTSTTLTLGHTVLMVANQGQGQTQSPGAQAQSSYTTRNTSTALCTSTTTTWSAITWKLSETTPNSPKTASKLGYTQMLGNTGSLWVTLISVLKNCRSTAMLIWLCYLNRSPREVIYTSCTWLEIELDSSMWDQIRSWTWGEHFWTPHSALMFMKVDTWVWPLTLIWRRFLPM